MKLLFAFLMGCSAMFAAPQAIILERINAPSDLSFRVAFWADVPAARRSFYADPAKVSAFKDATALELTALQNGTVAERVEELHFPAGTALAVIQARVEARTNRWQTHVDNYNPWLRYGSRWNGASWVAGGVN